MKPSSRAAAFCLFVIACFSVSLVYGQEGRGLINGTVADPTGALIGGAQVSIKNTLTGQVTTVTTTSDGNYSAPFLQPGNYEVSASHEGFQSETQSGLTLTADQVASVNFQLRVGASTTKVEVVASGTEIDTTTGAIAEVINEKAITELPLNGRNPAALVFVVPGAIDGTFTVAMNTPGSGSGFPNETQASVNGSHAGGVSYQLDGIVNMNNYFQTASPFPNPDATQEFRVITNNFDAQYGYSSGAIVQVATRSGTNQWHGTGFEFLRNNVLNSADYFTRIVDPLKRNQFGGSVGGPIVRDKLFIFGNVQFTRERVSESASGVQVPNNNELNGDFSQFCTVVNSSSFNAAGLCNNPAGQLYKGYLDHSAANAYLNNQIDPSTFSPISLALEQGLPKTDDPVGNVILQGIVQKTNVYEYTIRSDYNISSKQTLSGRIFYDNWDTPPYVSTDYLTQARSTQAQEINIYVGHTWTIRPDMVNDLRVGFSRNNSQAAADMRQPDGSPVSPSLLGADLNSVSNTIGNLCTNGFCIGEIPVRQGRHNWVIDDTLALTKGKHSIAVGVNMFTQYSQQTATWEADPLLSYNGSVTNNADADFLLGDLYNADTGAGQWNEDANWSWAAFGQDSFKIKPNLTVNVGIRWEPQIALRNLQHSNSFYIPGDQSTRFPDSPVGNVYDGDPGTPAGLWRDQWAVFLPRVSVAWSPKALPNTSIRSAFGYMVPPDTYDELAQGAAYGPVQVVYYNQVTPSTCVLNISNPFACYAPTNDTDPFPPFAGPNFQPPQNETIVRPVQINAYDRNFVPAREENWNLTIQHSVGSGLLFGLNYVGRHDFHMMLPGQLNPGIFVCAPVGPNCTQAQYNLNGTRAIPNFSGI